MSQILLIAIILGAFAIGFVVGYITGVVKTL